MEQEQYVIRFRFPDGDVYAGLHRGALCFTLTTQMALRFVSTEVAQRYLEDGFGPDSMSVAEVVTLEEAERAAAA